MSSATQQFNNEDMASNISNLNNMANLARNVENGITNMAHLNQNNMMPQSKDIPMPQAPIVNPYNQGMQQYPQIPNIQPNIVHNSMIEDIKKKSTLDTITNNIKEPVLIAIVFVILNHPSLLKALSKYIPQLATGENGPTVFNLVLRGLFLGSVVVILNKTVLK
jgi:hypothetical protein